MVCGMPEEMDGVAAGSRSPGEVLVQGVMALSHRSWDEGEVQKRGALSR